RPEPRKAEGRLSPELAEALASPVPISGLALTAAAAPFRGAAPDASVLVALEIGRGLSFIEREGVFLNDLEVSIAAFDHAGKLRAGGPTTVELKLQPRTHAAVVDRGMRLLSRLKLPPGRYQLRIGAREKTGGRVGTLFYDLEVPDFSQAPLSMSGLALVSKSASLVPTARPDPELKDLLPGPPTAIREFPPDDTLAVYAEVYEAKASVPHRVEITASVLAEGGRAVFNASEERSSDELRGSAGGYGYRTEIPLRGLAPGLYVLRVEARSRLEGVAPVARETLFRIRG
ncbi:MAG TPA: hypothetical protein VNI83_11675, partial [Vicinamibacterales bacterium]|nr:hypothetical protein [Vicinamibacterales bacterium]